MERKELIEHLKNSGMTQKHLAEELAVTQVTITNWVKGKSRITPKKAQKIRNIFSTRKTETHLEWDDNQG